MCTSLTAAWHRPMAYRAAFANVSQNMAGFFRKWRGRRDERGTPGLEDLRSKRVTMPRRTMKVRASSSRYAIESWRRSTS